MTSGRGERLHVAVSAAPALLSDSLRALLEEIADVTIVLDGPLQDEVFDLAVVTPTSLQPAAELTVVLDDRPATRGGGEVRSSCGSSDDRLDDLPAVLRFVDGLARGRGDR